MNESNVFGVHKSGKPQYLIEKDGIDLDMVPPFGSVVWGSHKVYTVKNFTRKSKYDWASKERTQDPP